MTDRSIRLYGIGRAWAVAAALAAVAAGCVAEDLDGTWIPDESDESTWDDGAADVGADEGAPDDSATDDDTSVIAAPAQFRHPGVLVNRGQLDFVRAKIAAGEEPWKTAYANLRASNYAKLSWQAKPRESVNCGPRSNPNEGCSDERSDAVAAYTHALMWYIDRDRAHADKAIEILDAWAKKIRRHTGHNTPLQTGWAASMFPAAGELIRYTYDGWSGDKRERFTTMLRDVYLPVLRKGNEGANGNWELIMTEALFATAVFLDDRAAFDKAVQLWRRRVPAYIYLSSDGPYPKAAGTKHNTKAKIIKYWQKQSTFVDGLAQETCRDFGHTQWGIAAALNGAETAYQQGVDLYGEQSERLRKGLEFHSDYILGKPAPSWLCGGDISLSGIPTWEIGFNHFRNRTDKALPLTQRYVREKVRSNRTPVNYFIAWETLTHAMVGKAGL